MSGDERTTYKVITLEGSENYKGIPTILKVGIPFDIRTDNISLSDIEI
jgi:hypothetical protein